MLANALALTTMERSFNLLVVFHIRNIAYLLNFRALASSHGLDEAPVVLLLGPDHLGWWVAESMVGFLMASLPYLPNFNSLALPHGLEETPVVHQPGPDHLGEDG